jgi:HK97 family phage prohead protease
MRPTDNLVRSVPFELRATNSGPPVMAGHFAVFNEWTEIHSWFEGDFLERVAPGAFAEVFASGAPVKVLYDHGADPSIGNKPLGSVLSVAEDKRGAAYEVGLFDSSYVTDLLPALRAGELGASFRFRVAGDAWETPSKPTKWNPGMLEERTITRVDPLYEFGPVTFPAYSGATAGVRSLTDQFFDRLLSDPAFVARMSERLGARIVGQMIDDGRAGDTPGRRQGGAADSPPAGTVHPSVLRLKAAALQLASPSR